MSSTWNLGAEMANACKSECFPMRDLPCGAFFACCGTMQRILVVLRAATDVETLRQRFRPSVAETHEMAVCYVLPDNEQGIGAMVEAQRRITVSLRRALDQRAERIAIFVVTDRDGDSADACARDWGATVVDP